MSIDGVTRVGPGSHSHDFSAWSAATVVGGDNNNVVTVGGSSLIGVDYSNPQQPVLDGAHHNNVVNFGGDVATNHTQTLADDV